MRRAEEDALLERFATAVDAGVSLWDVSPATVGAAILAALADDDVDRRERGVAGFCGVLQRRDAEDDMYGDHATVAWARSLLHEIGGAAWARLVALLDAEAPATRAAAASCFAHGIDTDEDVPLPGDGRAIERFVDEDAVRSRAWPRLVALVRDPDDAVRARALTALRFGLAAHADAATLAAIVAAARDPSPGARAAAIYTLRAIGGAVATEAAIARLDDESVEVRGAALFYLERWPTAAATPRLIERIADRAPGLGEHAMRLVGEQGDPAARPALAAWLRDAPDARHRLTGAFALAGVADASVVPVLRGVLARPEPAALMAALTLGGLGAREATDELLAFFARGPRRVGNFGAFEALAMLGDPRGADALRGFVEESIATHGWRDPEVVGRKGVNEEELDRRVAIDALGVLGDRAARRLVLDALARGDVYTRRSAALALGRVGEGRDVDALAGPLADADGPLEQRARLAALLLAPDRPQAHVAALVAALGAARPPGDLPFVSALRALATRLDEDPARPRAHAAAWRGVAEAVVAWTTARIERWERPAMSFEVPAARFYRARLDDLLVAWRTWCAA